MIVSLVILIFLVLWMYWFYSKCYDPIYPRTGDDSGSGNIIEPLSGYGVISGLAFNNNMRYCSPGNDRGWSGGCFTPNRVIV